MTVAVAPVPAVPPSETFELVKSVTGSLKVTVKLIGELLVALGCPPAKAMVAVGGVVLTITIDVLRLLVTDVPVDGSYSEPSR